LARGGARAGTEDSNSCGHSEEGPSRGSDESGAFFTGVIVGMALARRYPRDVRAYLDRPMRDVRARVAERLGSAADTIWAAKERLERGLTDAVEAAKSLVGTRGPCGVSTVLTADHRGRGSSHDA
jgi:hypothetical protein